MKNLLGVADYGMDVWYGGAYNLEQRLDLLKSCGIDGIEWLKGADFAEAMQNAITFHKMGMDFASCSMSSMELTLKCTCAFGKKYVWFTHRATRDIPFDVYCRRANAFVEAANYYGLVPALHNHLGTRVENQQELDDFMKAVPGAALLLDIAHLHGAEGDCIETIRKYHDRIAAVHFKDVFYKDKSIGLDRWSERLRFCELGGGNAGMDMEAIANELQKYKYDKWVLIEQDTHLQDPAIDLKKSADLLKELFA
ncbi:MAG: TIM barrel protein [Lentisphaeria bacterium]|nr:TIM barrel protein [Lentisphaeria bacterium]